MKLTLRTKLMLSLGVLAALGLSGLALYFRGRRVGVAKAEGSQVKEEVIKLEEEKSDIQKEVYSLDTDALHTRILALSRRVHEQATHRIKGLSQR